MRRWSEYNEVNIYPRLHISDCIEQSLPLQKTEEEKERMKMGGKKRKTFTEKWKSSSAHKTRTILKCMKWISMKMMQDESNQSALEWMMIFKEIMNESERFLWIIYYNNLEWRFIRCSFVTSRLFFLSSPTTTPKKNVKQIANWKWIDKQNIHDAKKTEHR